MSATLHFRVSPTAHPSGAERAAAGKQARKQLPRAVHAEPGLAEGRDPVTLIEQEGEGRVVELLPIRHARMCVSPIAFFRGTASLMAGDLAASPSTSLRVQLCGDAHLSNFGAFESPDRALVFDLNDFDETLPGPFEWDVKRMATSFEIAGRHRSLSADARRALALAAVGWYRRTMREFATMTNLAVWYSRLDSARVEEILRELHATRVSRAFHRAGEKARAKDSLRALGRLTEVVDGERRIISRPPLIVPIQEFVPADRDRDDIEDAVRELLRTYRRSLQHDRRVLLEQYRYIDLAHKVVGVGSVGTRCWIALLLGRDDEDPLVLQMKEASASVLEPYLGRARFANHGQRVVEGQRLMQATSDIFLGWIRNPAALDGGSRDFYIRQLWDGKGSIDVDRVLPEALEPYARICGWTLARAHARSGDRVAIASYLGKGDAFDRAIADYASAYADIAEHDYGALVSAVGDGRLPVSDG
jgi:uncharacterized protein (DUF2252 family)